MAAFVKFDSFVEAWAEDVHNFGSDVIRLALTDTAPTASSDTGFLPATLHPPPAAANGYTTGGNTLTITSATQSGGVYKVVASDTSFIASGGDIGPFRYVILYNDTAATDELVGYWDYGSSITLADGSTLPITFDASNGLVSLT